MMPGKAVNVDDLKDGFDQIKSKISDLMVRL